MLTAVGAPLLVNLAVSLGAPAGVQLLPVVHSPPGPVQVPEGGACALTSAGTAEQMPPANAMTNHAEPPGAPDGLNHFDCIQPPHRRSGPTRCRHHPRRTPQGTITRTNTASNRLPPLPRQARAFDAAFDDGSLRRLVGAKRVQIHSCDFRRRAGCRHVVPTGRPDLG